MSSRRIGSGNDTAWRRGVTGRKQNPTMGEGSTTSVYPGGVSLASHDGKRAFVGGKLCGDCFVKRVQVRHLLRTPAAVAIQSTIVERLESEGCKRIRVEVEDGRVFEVAFADFLRHAFRLDRGFGPQDCLPLSRWTDPKAPRQGELFEEAQ